MLRSIIAHVSLSAMLLHLAWGHCTLHLPACDNHCHHHADEPAEAPAHDDCHESHSSAVISQATTAPPPSDAGAPLLTPAVIANGSSASCLVTAASVCDADPLRPLPLRAHLRLGVLLN